MLEYNAELRMQNANAESAVIEPEANFICDHFRVFTILNQVTG